MLLLALAPWLCGDVLAQSNPIPGAPSLPLASAALANGVQGRITYQHGIEFVTIGAPGNADWAGNGTPGDLTIGCGGVNYEYRIGRYEVTTSQWVAFYNAAFDRPWSEWRAWHHGPSRPLQAVEAQRRATTGLASEPSL